MYRGHEALKEIHELSCEFMIQHKISPRILLDLGARHGEGLNRFKDICLDDYVFVEPEPRCCSIIKGVMNDYSGHLRLHLIEGILSDSEGNIEMYTFSRDDMQSSNVFSDRGGLYGDVDVINVPKVRYEILDSMFPQQKICFAKINIEGSEYGLIEDGFFHDRIESFVMEVHNSHIPGKTWKDVLAQLSDGFDVWTHGTLGYKYCYMSGITCK